MVQGAKIDGKAQGIGAVRLDSSFTAIGAPFAVNQRPLGSQQHPAVAVLSGGGAIVTWDSGLKGDSDVFARFLKPDGAFLSGELQVNPLLTTVKTNRTALVYGFKNNHLRNLKFRLADSVRLLRDRNSGAVVAPLLDGGAIVAYSGWRRIHTNWMQVVEVVKTSHGHSYTNDLPQKFGAHQDWMLDVFFQRFDSAGHKIGGEVLVNEFAKYNQRNPSIASLPDGSFVIAWSSETAVATLPTVTVSGGDSPQTAQLDIYARHYTAAGLPLGSEFKVNTSSRPCASPALGALSDGRFTVAWAQRDAVRTNGWDIYARIFSTAGSALGDAVRVNVQTYGDQFSPAISSAGVNQLVAWSSLGQDKTGSRVGRYVRPDGEIVSVPLGASASWQSVRGRLLSAGIPVGDEVRINSDTDSRKLHPSVASDGADRFLVLWTSLEDETGFDVAGQVYRTAQPATSGAVGGAGATPAGAAASDVTVTWSGPVEKLRLNWSAQPGVRYQVQRSADLKNWTNMGGPRSTAGAPDFIGIDLTESAAFFRVLRVP
ncbi:MAG: hypothetical protein QOF48_733 [Verrucomicrobiota bacterium]